MADTEKITINLSIVDLGQIDLLVSEGFYSSRTDFIRTAIRNQVGTHADAIKQTITVKTMAVGVVSYARADLEKRQAEGKQIEIKVVGLLHLDDDIPAELARATISAITVRGAFRASEAVKAALADRTH